jgi:hypothetical protein
MIIKCCRRPDDISIDSTLSLSIRLAQIICYMDIKDSREMKTPAICVLREKNRSKCLLGTNSKMN